MVAALALCLGIAGPAWAQLADPMAEDYATHVIPFYKSDANWAAFLLDGGGARFLTYILLVNGNNNSLVRLDSIPCRGAQGGPCLRGTQTGTWLRYDTFNTVAATFGDSGMFGAAGHSGPTSTSSPLEGTCEPSSCGMGRRVMDVDTSEETTELVKGRIIEKAASVIPTQAN
jgi:hypothetical protein